MTELAPSQPRPGPSARGAVIGIAAVVFGYALWRAFSLSLTHDEAITFLDQSRAPLARIFAFDIRVASNNHLAHTLLVKALVPVFGDAELVLRAPALLGLALFLFATASILERHLSGVRLVLGFALVTTNPFALDFFSLSRGYGLALGLGTLSIDALLRLRGTRAIVFGALAVLANLAFATLFLAIAGVVVGAEVLGARRAGAWRAPSLVSAVLASVALAGVYRPSVLARIQGPLQNWGGETGVWEDTLPSLIRSALYLAPKDPTALVPSLRIAALAVLVGGALLCVRARRGTNAAALARVTAVLVLIAVGLQLQVRAFHMPFPVGRAVLYLVPLFALNLLLLWGATDALRGRLARVALRTACGVLVAGLIVLQGFGWNTTHALKWRYDADTKAAMRDFGALANPGDGRVDAVELAAHWALHESASYYRVRNRWTWLAPIVRGKPLSASHDFYLLRNRKQAEQLGVPVAHEYVVSGMCLGTR